MYYGIEINEDKTFTVAVIDENRNIFQINHFWKEGLLWFLEHSKVRILTININNSDKKHFPQKLKNLLEIKNLLLSNFEFRRFSGKVEEKIFAITDTDLFFQKSIRKELLPIYTREGLEQRIYNLPKSGIIIPEYLLSKDKRKLRKEVNAIVAAFTSFAIDKNMYTEEKIEKTPYIVPVYKYVPKNKRVITGRI